MLTTRIAKPLVPASASLFVNGAPGDLVALADVKLELNLPETADDLWLARVITRASSAAANYCNRTFQPTLWQDQVWPAKDAYPWQLPPRLAPLQLSSWPILSTPSPAQTAPPVAPTLGAVAGGSLPAQPSYVRVSYLTPYGETAASLESFAVVPAGALLSVAPPGPDLFGIATGWNVYTGSSSFGETLQNATPLGLGSVWTEPTTGLTTTGAAPPPYVSLCENAPIAPVPLAEGIDFTVDPTLGHVTRLFEIDEQPKPWSLPVVAVYSAGFSVIPADVQDAVLIMVKGRWYGRQRDPMIRSQNMVGVYEAAYFFATGPGGQGDLSVDAMAKLDRYRVPVTA